MNARRLAAKLIGQYIKNIKRYARKVLLDKDPEALHQLRVHLRRLRNILWMFRGFFLKRKLRSWTQRMRILARCSSPLRDGDVYIDYLNSYKRKIKGVHNLKVMDILIDEAKQQRKKAYFCVVKAIDKFSPKKVFEDIEGYLARWPGLDDSADLYAVCRKKIFKRVKQLLVFEKISRQPGNIEGLHRMRIATKHLRYSLEGVKEIYSISMSAYIERVLGVHRRLGAIHDYDVWMMHMDQFVLNKKLEAVDKKGLNELKKYSKAARNRVYKEFALNWAGLRRDRFFEELREYVKPNKTIHRH